MISLHFLTSVSLRKTIIEPIQVDFYGNTFDSNEYKINTISKDISNPKLDSYTLYSLGGNVQLLKLFSDNEINGSQPVSSDYINLLYTTINFLIRNSVFS